jgi:hypothetical protein
MEQQDVEIYLKVWDSHTNALQNNLEVWDSLTNPHKNYLLKIKTS